MSTTHEFYDQKRLLAPDSPEAAALDAQQNQILSSVPQPTGAFGLAARKG